MCSDHKTLYEIQNTNLKFFFSFYSIQHKETKDFKNEKKITDPYHVNIYVNRY